MVQLQAFGYSSNVQLTLIVNGQRHALSQIGPDYVVVRAGCELPVADAEVVMVVDGREQVWPVRLSSGAVPFDRQITIADR